MTESDVLKCMKRSVPMTRNLGAVPASLFLDCAEVVAPYVTEIENFSLTSGTVPDSYNLAIVRPQLKKNRIR